jgi:Concanavalin A-like lectin/glucanases superfamily
MKATVCLFLLCLLPRAASAAPNEPGLLFYLSGDKEFTADYAAGGDPRPNFIRDVRIIPDGAKGPGFECANSQLMSYWAPGNIYAERGTLAFSWRSRYAVGPTAFPIFRVGYADHSSWDMAWLRIDYNGRGGFDAFVTDASLSRIRVSYVMPSFPKPNEWVHLALAWDETRGIRFYVNGRPAAKKDARAVLYAGLDQFGPHSRTISPMQVQSDYNFIRGGDLDELRVYDRMLSDENVAALARGEAPRDVPPAARDLGVGVWREEWWLRYGWNRAGDAPPYLASAQTSARKVEIHDAFDLKRWWWKGTDGIRETTWPGVFNRSRLPGRDDYFQLPDWDCYSLSGKAVTFTMPDEAWNHLEISGAAWGRMSLEGGRVLFERPKGQEKTFHRLASTLRGRKIKFENVEQEQPIGELSAYNVAPGAEPRGTMRLEYTLSAEGGPEDAGLADVRKFIKGRYTEDERGEVVAVADSAGNAGRRNAPGGARAEGAQTEGTLTEGTLPLVHVLIPAERWRDVSDGLDGIRLELPALGVKPTHGGLFPLNVQVKDPLWPHRNLFDFSFSVKPGEARTLWLDTRDRILPEGRALYLTLAGAGADFRAAALEGARVRLVFKPRAEAAKEHELDRFTQARDVYAMSIEERPNTPRLNLYNRFAGDINDLLRVNPNHRLGQSYWYDLDRSHPKPAFTQPAPPAGVPLWAFRQVEQLRYLKRFVLWYIDHRQIENGEFGGGLSDDGDLTNWWPGLALMGAEPEKVKGSLLRHMETFYAQGMFTNGLSTIQTDELHSYEEGIQVLGQSLLLDYGDPKQLERAMETSRALLNLTGVNRAGHRHIRSSYFSGTRMATEEPWGWSKPHSILVFHPALMLVRYNGNPEMKRVVTELADGFLAHRRKGDDGRFRINGAIRFDDDADAPWTRGSILPFMWGAYRVTGDAKYLQPFRDEGARSLSAVTTNGLDLPGVRGEWEREVVASAQTGAAEQGPAAPPSNAGGANSGRIPLRPPPNYTAAHLAWQATGDKRYLEALYAAQIEASALREYMNTEGSMWIDRVEVPNGELQRARLGGVALTRNAIYPGHAVSWSFRAPSDEESVAILVSDVKPDSLKIVVHNLSGESVWADMTAWELEPGRWEIEQGLDANGDDEADGESLTQTVELERAKSVQLIFTPRVTTILTLKLVQRGVPYSWRPDLGIGRDDISVRGRRVTVTVHSLGAQDTRPTTLALVDASGKTLATAAVPALKTPVDLLPKRVTLTLELPAGARLEGASVLLDPENSMKEITRVNNRVKL